MVKPLLALIVGISLAAVAESEPLRLNEIQVFSTHNSYHLRTTDRPEWAYSFPPLNEQLDLGIRGLVLDLYHQPDDSFRVMHIPVLDAGTTCKRLRDCLTIIRDWSKAHPTHIPIFIQFEVKNNPIGRGSAKTSPIERDELEILERRILSVFKRSHLITPNDLRRGGESVIEGIRAEGWPLLDDVRGKCIVLLQNRGRLREEWLYGQPKLAGRAMFSMANGPAPDAAFLVIKEKKIATIPERVREGYMVRHPLHGLGTTGRDTAGIASGAQILSVDYPEGIPHYRTGYVVSMPGDGIVRANPLLAPNRIGEALED